MIPKHPNPPPLPPASAHHPPPLPPSNSTPAPSAGPVLVRFFAGLILGSLLSLIVYFGGWRFMTNHHIDWLIWVVPVVKLAVGITSVCIRGFRSFGAGVLVSIALGALIFMGACMANIDWSTMH